jgi:hypothetical protein
LKNGPTHCATPRDFLVILILQHKLLQGRKVSSDNYRKNTKKLLFQLLSFHFVYLSNSNSLANQPSIHLILAKQEKWSPTIWQTNLAKLTSPRAYMRADRGCHHRFPVGGRVKKEIKNREGFLL